MPISKVKFCLRSKIAWNIKKRKIRIQCHISDFLKWLNDLNLVSQVGIKIQFGFFVWRMWFQGKSRFFNNLIWFHKLDGFFHEYSIMADKRGQKWRRWKRCPSHHCLSLKKCVKIVPRQKTLKNCKYWPLKNKQKTEKFDFSVFKGDKKIIWNSN